MQYKVLLYVFKALKQEAPLNLEELVNIYKPARSLRSESNTTFVTPIVRTKSYRERRFDKVAERTSKCTVSESFQKETKDSFFQTSVFKFLNLFC